MALVADPALGIGSAPTAQAEVPRRLVTTVKKLGGGSVRLTVKGTAIRPLKVSITSGGQGSVTFNLGSRHGRFGWYVDVGIYADLFWPQSRTATFKL